MRKEIEQESWKKSRSGAWAGRGFHIQHLFSTLLLVRLWAGTETVGYMVPEGLDDCVVKTSDKEYWIQVKSRKRGLFSDVEIQKITDSTKFKIDKYGNNKTTNIIIALEHNSDDTEFSSTKKILTSTRRNIVYFSSIGQEIISLLALELNIVEILAEGIADNLYKVVVEASEANAALPFSKRRKISISEVECLIQDRLMATDSSAIDEAYKTGVLKAVNFNLSIEEPSFYQGVKVNSGHVASGLVIERPKEVADISKKIMNRQHVLISGPSGAGKSALLWLTTNHLSGNVRWMQITHSANFTDAEKIIRYVRARSPSSESPIGLIFDEISSVNSRLWDVLVYELGGLPFVHLLGSIRHEDESLITRLSDTEFHKIELNAELAEAVWTEMIALGQTSNIHWREPYEQSNGLMLEYVHLLTKGKRLAEVIKEQVQERVRERRLDELAIIRSTSIISSYGGEIVAQDLFVVLGIEPSDASFAMQRLLNEHLIKENQPGILGGLHSLRSEALTLASHDDIAYLIETSLWQCLDSVSLNTLPQVIQAILIKTGPGLEAQVLGQLGLALSKSDDIDVWVAVLDGLGRATVERMVIEFITCLEEFKIDKAHWFLVSMFVDPRIDFPDLSEIDQWNQMNDAIQTFRGLERFDFRSAYLAHIGNDYALPICDTLQKWKKLISTMVPIMGGDSIGTQIFKNIEFEEDVSISDIAELLSAVLTFDKLLAVDLVHSLGGEEKLFEWFYNDTPWVTKPVIDENGEYGKTVISNWYKTAEDYQNDPHTSIVDICNTLMFLSPTSESCSSMAIDPLGGKIQIGEYALVEKNIPRENTFSKEHIHWNVAFRKIFGSYSNSSSLSEYSNLMADLVRQTEKLFRKCSEKWIIAKFSQVNEQLYDEINQLIDATNSLSQVISTTSEKGDSTDGNESDPDTIGALIVGVLENLLPRMCKFPGEDGAGALAGFAADLSGQAESQRLSDIWRTTLSPPLEELASLSERLINVSNILREFAYSEEQTCINKIVKSAKRARKNNGIKSAGQLCKNIAMARFQKVINSVEAAIFERGWTAKVWIKPIQDKDSPYWPAVDLAIIVELPEFELELSFLDDIFEISQEYFENCSVITVAPVINGNVIAPLAMSPIFRTTTPILDQNFSTDWEGNIDFPFFTSVVNDKFEQGMTACIYMSAINASRDMEHLQKDEEDAFLKSLKKFEENVDVLIELSEDGKVEYVMLALDCLSNYMDQVRQEIEDKQNGIKEINPICMLSYDALSGNINEQTVEIGTLKMVILEEECKARIL